MPSKGNNRKPTLLSCSVVNEVEEAHGPTRQSKCILIACHSPGMPSDVGSHSFSTAKSKAREVATQDKDMLSGATAQPVKALTIEACRPKICGSHTKSGCMACVRNPGTPVVRSRRPENHLIVAECLEKSCVLVTHQPESLKLTQR